MEERRRNDANLFKLHEENRLRLDALAATQVTLRTNQEAMRASIDDLSARIEEHEQDGELVNKQLARINGALFDDNGNNRLATVVDIVTTLKMNGKAIMWLAIVVGGFGAAIGWVWNHLVHA